MLFAALVLTTTRSAEAECASGAAVTHDCELDLVSGPVLASSRVIGMGGAYEGIANGLDGYTQNAAAPAVRDPWSHSWFDYDLDASISFPSAFRNVDYENRGHVSNFTYNDFFFLTLGANVQLGAWGFGFVADLQNYNLTPGAAATDAKFSALVSKTHVLVARQLFGGELVLGTGLRLVGFQISRTEPGQSAANVVSLAGAGLEIGALYRPAALPFRAGLTLRSPVRSDDPAPGAATEVNGMVIPTRANLPWEIDTGIAVQAGPRAITDAWINPHDEEAEVRAEILTARARREQERSRILQATPAAERAEKARALDEAEARARKEEDDDLDAFTRDFATTRKARWDGLPQEYLLLSAGLLVTGPTNNGISLESFFSQQVARAGRVATFSPRAGMETELVPAILRLRVGTYIEPTRFGSESDVRAFRQHVTGGFDLYLFRWGAFGVVDAGTRWRLSTAVDVAPRWQNYGLSIGFWH